MNYNKLTTKPFLNKNIKQKITKKILIDALKECYLKTRFSTLPYHFFNLNSRQSIKKYSEGNCIALSMYLRNYLKKIGFKSFLIPATIPYYIQHPDLLDISHIALAIPVNKDKTFIVDAAFYFINPLLVEHRLKKNKPIDIMNFSDNGLENISSFNEKLFKKKVYNQYQSIPRGTNICKCVNTLKSNIHWDYILREIINPDKSVTSFFLQVRKDPFYLSTGYKNGRCTIETELNISGDYISINHNQKPVFSGNMSEATPEEKKIINLALSKYK